MAAVRQALRFALDPTEAQRRACARHAGTARFAYNWGLRRVRDALDARRAGDATGRIPSAMTLHREWNAWKRSPDGIPWWGEVSKCARVPRKRADQPAGVSPARASHQRSSVVNLRRSARSGRRSEGQQSCRP